ncbi:MAG: hypothetical protein P8X90_35690 [Desulfobacterales bacterium]
MPQIIEEYPQKHGAQKKLDKAGKPAEPAQAGSIGIDFVAQADGT